MMGRGGREGVRPLRYRKKKRKVGAYATHYRPSHTHDKMSVANVGLCVPGANSAGRH